MKSRDHPNEEIPLHPPSTVVKPDNSSDSKGWFLSRTKLIIMAVLFIILVIIIIVLAVLYGVATATKREVLEKPDENATEPSTAMPTPIVPTTPGTEAWWNPRLPTNIIPKHYNLFLNITVDLPRFDGRVGIDIEVNNNTDLIILHNNGLNVSSVQVLSKSENRIMKVKNHFPFEKYFYHVIQMSSELQEGPYLLKITFQGFFQSMISGMFRKSITRPNGQKAFIAGTQFQETYARKAFPCFDEPALKATFNTSIAHRADYVALSNMPIYKTETINGQKIDYYEKTVTMSTYLLAFVVGDFKYVETISKNNIKIRIYSRPSYLNKTHYASSIGGKILTFFENYLGVPYPLSKEDHVAVPQFGTAAMENWGLIIYGEEVLLWDSKESTERDKMTVTTLMAHEIAHQWFGNLVTCKWWDDLWLNEGFASYFADTGMTSVIPSWKKDDRVSSSLTGLLETDAELYSHPVKLDAKSPDEFFSSIIYNKGSRVISMLEGFLGNITFLEGLKIYFKRHAFANVESDDLWRAMTEASCAQGKCVDVKQIMDTWILQMGYPVLTFKKINSTHYLISQRRFLMDDKANLTALASKSPFGDSWVVPLSYAIENQSSSHFTWMNKSSSVIKWDGNGWIKANLGHKGFFITNYEEENWKALAMQLKRQHTVFSSSGRAGLLVDAMLLVKVNKLNISTALRLTEYMEKETEIDPWEVFFQIMSFLSGKLPKESNAYKYLMKYMAFLGKNQYERLGFNDVGTMIDKIKREYFLSLFCKVQDKTCIGNATEHFQAWMEDPKNVEYVQSSVSQSFTRPVGQSVSRP
ncbi:glutamyl aminopeptidase-like, partial [Actinia tenebrosa]|uniref:Aminopeptidase n=1 Tax=Actinia tenebrosa TaxID=6105 RepID=A0A6P8H0U5_ACTTE